MFDTVLIPIYMVGLGSVQITALLKVEPLSQFPVQILFTLVCQNVPIQQFVTSSWDGSFCWSQRVPMQGCGTYSKNKYLLWLLKLLLRRSCHVWYGFNTDLHGGIISDPIYLSLPEYPPFNQAVKINMSDHVRLTIKAWISKNKCKANDRNKYLTTTQCHSISAWKHGQNSVSDMDWKAWKLSIK